MIDSVRPQGPEGHAGIHRLLARSRAFIARALTIRRTAARVILIDASDRVLLFRRDSRGDGRAPYWYLPGGGMHGGESPQEAARRELREETGIDAELGPIVLHARGVRFRFGGRQYEQEEWYVVGRVREARFGRGSERAAGHRAQAHRWWSSEELDRAEERIHPRELPAVVEHILRDRPPDVPWEAGDR